jgi:subtilase family protein
MRRRRGGRAGALALLLALPGTLSAQRPAVSPPLARAWRRDTTFTVWIFVRHDLPLDSAAAALTAAGARIRVRSRWLHAVSADVPAAPLQLLARSPLWRRIQPLGRWRRPRGPDPAAPAPSPASLAAAADTCPAGGDPTYGSSEMPYRRLTLRPLADQGVDGTGVRIVILDGGFDTQNPAFTGVTVTAQYDFVFHDSIVRDQPGIDAAGAQFHGTAVWSLFAGAVPGRLVGIARGASYLLAKTEDIRSETRVEEDNYVAALEWADSIGVDIASSSLGYLTFDNGFGYTPGQLNGDVAVTTVAAESAATRGILLVTAGGNGGPAYRTLVTPGDARSVITAGAEDSLGTIAAFSSRGPTADGRLKPDLTAPGVAVCAVTGTGLGRLNGTSFATPLLAASAALVKELHPGLGPLPLRAALRRFASNTATPDSTRGWGRPDVAASATFPAGITPLAPLPPVLGSITPTFQWADSGAPPSAAPVTYRLRAARDSGFSASVLDTTVVDQTSIPLARALKPGAPLFWRVEATSATGVAASTGTVGPITVPPWATLLTLSSPGGATTVDTQPTFVWTSPPVALPPGPLHYDLFVFRTALNFPDQGYGGLTDTTLLLPQPLERNVPYTWRVVVHAGADTSLVRSAGTFLVLDPTLPAATLLYQNFPNPFPAAGRDSTCIWFDLATASRTELVILDLRGSPVRHLIPAASFPEVLDAGRYGRSPAGGPICDARLTWDGRADDGRIVPSGVYLYKLQAGGVVQFKRIVFMGKAP